MEKNKKFYRFKRFWLMLLLAVYLLLGFFYAPKVIEQQLQQQLSSQLNMQAEMSEVNFNPLTFSTEISNLSITDANQQNWYTSQITGINFDPLNLLWGQWKFSDLQLHKPHIVLQTNQAGEVVVPAIPEFSNQESADEVLNLIIDDIRLEQGQLQYQADNIKKDFSLAFKTIEISHEKLSLTDEDTRFEVAFTTTKDELITLSGHYNHVQQQVQSQLVLENWQATTINNFLPDHLLLHQQDGMIQANGSLDWHLTLKPQLEFTAIEVSDLAGDWQQAVLANQLNLNISAVSIDTEAQTIAIDNIESDQGEWQVLWPLSQAPQPALEKVSANNNTEADSWQIDINQVQIENWPVEFLDYNVDTLLPISIETLNLTGANNHTTPFTLNSEINLAQGGTLAINSEQSLLPFQLNSDITVTSLALTQLSPWIADNSGLIFTQGTLNSSQKLQFKENQTDLKGSLSIDGATIENQQGQNIATWGQLMIGASHVSSQNKTILIDQITLDQGSGNVIIDAEKNINIQNLKSSAEDEGDSESSAANDWIIKVGAINIKDTSTALIDQSIEPPVTTSISELNGAIKGLSSESLSKADVNLTGKFNQFSPLTIEGQINPLSSDAYTDLKVLIEDLDLLAFSPYAASYLAFPIIGGKLNVELEYSLNQSELQGKNNLLFKQFKLGDRTDSPDAINLPLKLAVSLLSDMNGEMKINLPVSGNINDPEFSYGGLIGKAFFKLITSIVASPFKILGALIPNPDPNLSEIQFIAGQSDLLQSEQNKLNQIAEIMAKKPNLNLQLNPHIGNNFDRKAIQSQWLLSQAPLDQLNFTDPVMTDWIKSQLSAEQMAQHSSDSGLDYAQLWQLLAASHSVNQETIDDLTQQRNLSIKNYLIESASITAERIFIEQAKTTDLDQALVKIGVSR